MNYRALAESALERRSELFTKRKRIANDTSTKNDEKRGRLAEIDAQMDALAAEARDYVAEAERQGEIRDLMGKAGPLAEPTHDRAEDAHAWRALLPSREEVRAAAESTPADGGYTVPSGTGTRLVDMLRNRAVLLGSLPAENVIRFNTDKFTLPVLADSDMPTLVAENALISEGDETFAGLEFKAKKYASVKTASNEILADNSVSLRNALAQAMVRDAAAAADIDGFTGDGAATPLLGILGQGNTVEVGSTAGDLPTWNDVFGAVGRIWDGNAEPTAIYASPDAAIALEGEREGTDGAFLQGERATALRLPILRSSSVPAGTVAVADASRIYAGIRQDIRVATSEHARFENDQVVFRLTFRVGGIYVVETSSVQVLKANDGV